MTEPRAQRTLVKSPPELWAEVSDAAALARHLGEFGDIRITRLEPETTVAWEGDRASGTVELEAAGWGTKVTLTATPAGAEAPAAPEPEPVAVEPEPVAVEPEPVAVEPEPEPVAVEPEPEAVAVDPAKKKGFFARLFGRKELEVVVPVGREPEPEPEPVAVEPEPEPPAPEPEPEPEPAPAPVAVEPEPAGAGQLDSDETVAILTTVLDDLGAAHHRPFSRS